MKKIGIDARLYYQTGVGVYLRNLLSFLQRMAPKDIVFYVYLMREDVDKIKFENKNFIKRGVTYKWHSFEEQFDFGRKLYEDNLDLTHFTYFSYPITYKGKFIATVHDTTPLLYKTGRASTKNQLVYEVKHFFFRIVLSSQVRNASLIITPSLSVKKQLVKTYGSHLAKKIIPIYEGVNQELLGLEENGSLKSRFNKDFFIYVGNFYPHKNVERLVRAFAKIKKDIQLILVGPDDYFSAHLIQLIKKLNQQKRITIYTNPTKEDLIFFYKHALALINPSLSEGFGLPQIEAAYFNLPIIASNIDVFKEILKKNYLSFDPYKEEDIVGKINRFLETRPKFDYREVLKDCSFEQMAKETLKIYQRVTQNSCMTKI